MGRSAPDPPQEGCEVSESENLYARGRLMVPADRREPPVEPPIVHAIAAWVSEGEGSQRGDWVVAVAGSEEKAVYDLGRRMAEAGHGDPLVVVSAQSWRGKLAKVREYSQHDMLPAPPEGDGTVPAVGLLCKLLNELLQLAPGSLTAQPVPVLTPIVV